MKAVAVDPASFRDPSGFVFTREGTLFRQVQIGYRREYDRLMASGLYQSLVDSGLLIPHEEERADSSLTGEAYRVLRPARLSFISYPYEWCFSQLKDAAMATLGIQKQALRHGMILKDASAYNIQFNNGKPALIDTLSFETYEEGSPWVAYRQFCQHFVAPLALMSKTDIRLGQLLRTYIDGIPLDLAGRLLPRTTKLDPGLLAHIHMHGAAQKRHENDSVRPTARTAKMPRRALEGLIDSLESTVRKLSWKPDGTVWSEYYENTNYTDSAMVAKRLIVEEMIEAVDPKPRMTWDLGANTGEFSRIAARAGSNVIAWDIDPGAVEKNYLACREHNEPNVTPLLEDLTNPSPDLGWALQERKSLVHRGPADLVMALALVHHLAIGNNVPLSRVGSFFRSVGKWLIVEFVPKTDSQVQRLLASREDIFGGYTQPAFESDFAAEFEIIRRAEVPGTERTLYLMRGR